jgi:hypothetical protein
MVLQSDEYMSRHSGPNSAPQEKVFTLAIRKHGVCTQLSQGNAGFVLYSQMMKSLKE